MHSPSPNRVFLLLIFVHACRPGSAQQLVVSPAVSSIVFEIEHLGALTVSGRFEKFSGSLDTKNRKTRVHGEIEAASVNTNNTYRDNVIKGEQYLSVLRYPNIVFDGSFSRDGLAMVFKGELTLCKESRSISWTAHVEGESADHLRLQGNFIISRSSFNLNFGAMNDLIGNEVRIHVDLYLRASQ